MKEREEPPLWNDEPPQEFDPFEGPALPLGAPGRGLPEHHVSFNEFWASLGLEVTPESERLRELFYEWLGQNGYDVHDRDEPTVMGSLEGWREVWKRYRTRRRLT